MDSRATRFAVPADAPIRAAPAAAPRARVALIVALLSHYREPFYDALRAEFDARGIELRLLYGVTNGHWSRVLEWAEPFRTREFPGGATWFPVFRDLVRSADVVISEDASRHLINYAFLAARRFDGPKLALWGHGWNHQQLRPHSIRERLKAFVSRRADGFLAYTPGIRVALIERGYEAGRIHDVSNTLPAPDRWPSRAEVERLRSELGLSPDAPVALYCGQMYPMKRLELLIEAAGLVRERLPKFELILAGAGPTEALAEQAARREPYIHYVGPIFGDVKTRYFALSDACVIPGIVGLALVDAFHHHIPAVVTRMRGHGPEIEYLRHEGNGLMTEHTPADLANGIVRALSDDALRARLVEGCRESSADLTIANMVERFVRAIECTLGAEKVGGRVRYG